MKFTKIISIIIVFFTIFTSCRKDDDQNFGSVNDFVWRGLNSWYLWQPDVPQLADQLMMNPGQYQNVINGKSPDQLFYSLLYKYNTVPRVDRFSWIVSDVDALMASFSGVTKSNGMDFALFAKDNSSGSVVGIVNYVVPASPAALAGIKRGDVITRVNNTPLTTNNYTDLLNEQYSITIADTVMQTAGGIVTTDGPSYNLSAVVLEENPVAFYKKFEQNGKNIGYLVYNSFRSNYNDELNNAFATMKADGINELILDLRYNGGGSVESAAALGQMITGQFTGQPYVHLNFNQKHGQYSSTETLSNSVKIYDFANGQTTQTGTQTANTLQLSKVYVLTSAGSASASELTIQGLRAYINVITVGSETYGKFVGSNTLFDSPGYDYLSYEKRNKGHRWAMQPITFAYVNGNSDPNPVSGGISADYEVNPYAYFGTMAEFGELSDPGLSTALNLAAAKMAAGFGDSPFKKMNNFVGNKKTLSPFGADVYIEPSTLQKR